MIHLTFHCPPGDLAVNRAWRIRGTRMRRSPLYEQTSGAVIYDLREQYSGSTLACTVKVMMKVSWVGEGGDIDAPIKGVLDCLERAGVLHNDKQVTELHVEKMMQQDEGKIDVWIEPTQVNW